VLDRGRAADGTPYYAMECLEGVTLAEEIAAHGPMTAERAIHVLDAIAAALEEAHAVGLVHRDVKPANVFLTGGAGASEQVKLLDFGLAAQVGRAGEASALGPARPATAAGDATLPAPPRGDRLAGTPLYMAPEAITAPDRIDGRTDLYALGAVGYFLLTGQDVFSGRTVPEVCGHHLHSTPVPPSRRLGAPVPAGLEAAILACLAKDPARRPSSATALRAALRAALPDCDTEQHAALAA
jgi:serine/threonine protein kinase